MRRSSFRATALILLVLTSAPVTAATARAQEMPPWMTWDAAAKRVKMEIVAGKDTTNGGWNFNGYASGNLTITVPAGAAVEIAFRNDDVLPHSLVVIDGDGPLPPQGGTPAFPRAFTVNLIPGIVQGKGDTVRFTADRPGKYRLFCGVPTHGIGGMWDWLAVSAQAQAQAPSATTKAAQ